MFVCSEVLGGGDGVSFCWAILLVPENYDSCSCIFTDNSLITSSSQLYNQLKAMSYTKYTGQRFRTSDLWLHLLQLELGCTDFLRHMLCLGVFLFIIIIYTEFYYVVLDGLELTGQAALPSSASRVLSFCPDALPIPVYWFLYFLILFLIVSHCVAQRGLELKFLLP